MCIYVAVISNRNSSPAVLLREFFREGGRVRNRTLANLSPWPPQKVEALRQVLKGNWATELPLPQAFEITRSTTSKPAIPSISSGSSSRRLPVKWPSKRSRPQRNRSLRRSNEVGWRTHGTLHHVCATRGLDWTVGTPF